MAGKSSSSDNIVRCREDGTWDFGDLRCEGPVCNDPGRPADGSQIAKTYEQGAEVLFSCNRPGYVPLDRTPAKCTRDAVCKVIKPIGISSGEIPDVAINATSQRSNYEAKVGVLPFAVVPGMDFSLSHALNILPECEAVEHYRLVRRTGTVHVRHRRSR